MDNDNAGHTVRQNCMEARNDVAKALLVSRNESIHSFIQS